MTARRFTPKPNPALWGIDLVQQQLVASSTWLANETTKRFLDDMRDSVAHESLGSPIEVVFAAWFRAVVRLEPSNDFELLPQVEVPAGEKVYRLDFRVTPANVDAWFDASEEGLDFPKFAVELDGHDFHERTKEQVTWRNQRDRDLRRAGWRLFHFSGSELVKDPKRCVREVINEVADAYWPMYFQLRRIQGQRRIDSQQRTVEIEPEVAAVLDEHEDGENK